MAIRRKIVLLLATMVAAMLLATGVAMAASAVDQEQTSSPDQFYSAVSSDTSAAQLFTAGVSGTLDKVSVSVAVGDSSGQPGDLVAEVRTVDGAGTPTTTILGSGKVSEATVPAYWGPSNPIQWTDIALTQTATITAGTKYALVLRAPDAGYEEKYIWLMSSSDVYAGGNKQILDKYGQWVQRNNDFVFKTYVSEATNVALDIKPQTCPNALSTSDKGSYPVAIVGSGDLDVSQIVTNDPTKPIKLEGVSAQALSKGAIKDTATPYTGTITNPPQSGQCTKAGADGKQDLNLKFDAQQVVKALGTVTNQEARVVKLEAYLKDGTYVIGEDVIVTNTTSTTNRIK
jgi:hypothetical protein